VKKITTFILFSTFWIYLLPLSAQTWFPVNAEWTYQTFSPFDPFNRYGIDYIKCIKDTLIEGNRASVISGFPGCSPFYGKQIFYYNSAEDIVYVFINDEFKPYFDFSKKVGESYYMYFPNTEYFHDLPYDSLEVPILSITNEIIGGINIRIQHFAITPGYYHFFRGPIMEYIGGVYGFYPESGSCDFTLFNGLHCYSDEYLSYYSNPIFQEKGCDYIPLNIFEQSHKFSIYPNPANEFIMLDSDEKFAKIEIYNILGKCVLSQENFKNNHIYIHALYSGIYYIKASLITGHVLTHKFIKL